MGPFEGLFRMAGVEQALRDLYVPLLALGLGAARPLGMALTFPVFTRAELGGLLRAALSVGLALPIIGQSTPAILALGDAGAITIALIAAKEILVGALLGFLLGLPFWAIQSVGELVDAQRGITAEGVATDPSSKSQSSVTATLLSLTAMALFLAAGGMQTVVSTAYGSLQLWPQTSFLPRLGFDGAMVAIRLIDDLMRYAFLVAGPVIGLLLLVDIGVMMVGRAAPNLNSQDLAPTIKNVVFILFIGLYLSYLATYMKEEIAGASGVLRQLQELLR